MKRIIIALEAMAHEFVMNTNPPNIIEFFGGMNIHPAVTWGLGSRPSAAAYMGGMLPVCSIPQCYHRQIQINWSNPFFMSLMKKHTDKVMMMTSNGWTVEIMLPWIDSDLKKRNLDWITFRKDEPPAEDMIDYFLEEQSKYNSYFAYFQLFETHYPFTAPNVPVYDNEPIEERMKYRKDAMLYLDKQIGRIFKEVGDKAEIVLCSDHNLPPLIVSAANDTPAPQTILSFIATNFTETEKTYDGDHEEWAKEVWLKEKLQQDLEEY